MALQTAQLPFITRVIVPKRREDKIRRLRLLEIIKSRVNKRIQVICGPAGYGKTSLLVDFVNEAEFPVCWYSFAPEDYNPSLFFRYCLQSIRNQIPDFGDSFTDLCQAVNHSNWRTELGFFVNALQSDIIGSLIFVIDDVHWIKGKPELEQALGLLIERAPDKVHFVLGTRVWPSFDCLPKLAAEDEVGRINTLELRFSEEETAELLTRLWDREVTQVEAKELNDWTRGWPAAIMLTARSKTTASIPKLVAPGDEGILFEYLSREIFDKLPDPLKYFLLRTSVLREFTTALCAKLFDLTDPQATIEHIKESGLFLEERLGSGTVYAFHDLFRNFLEEKFRSEFPDEHRQMHHSAGELFLELADADSAIYHFVESGDYAEAAAAIKTVAGSYYTQARWQKLESLLDLLPNHFLEGDSELLLLSGQILTRLGKPTEALARLDRLTEENHTNCPENRGNAFVAKSTAYRRLGHLDLAVAAAGQGLEILLRTQCSKECIAEAHKQLGDCFYTEAKYDRAKHHLHTGLGLISKANLRLFSLISNDLGITYMELGDLDQAAMYLEQSKTGLLQLGSHGILAEILGNLALVYYHRGEFDLALDEILKSVNIAQEAGYPRVLATGLMNRSLVQRALGAYADSLDSASQALEMSKALLDQRLIGESTNALGDAYRKLNETSKAEVLLRQALLEAENSGQKYIAAIYNISLGKVYCQVGSHNQALECLNNAEAQLTEVGSPRRIGEAKLYQAAVYLRTGKLKESLTCLSDMKALWSKDSFDGFLLADGEELLDVLRFAIAKRVGGDTLVRLVARISADYGPDEMEEQSFGGAIGVKRFPDLRVFAFGGSKVFLGGHEVADGEWRSRKAKELFFYLLAKKHAISSDQIVESLWPEMSVALSDSALKTNVYRLRQALFFDCIQVQSSGYRINPEVSIEFDLTRFQEYLKSAVTSGASREEREKFLWHAVELHDGPFLGEFYSEWCEDLRTDLEMKYHAALMSLASYQTTAGNYHRAVELLEKVIESDPYNEEAQYQRIQSYVNCNEPFLALQQLRKFAKISVEELGGDLPARFFDCHKTIIELLPNTA